MHKKLLIIHSNHISPSKLKKLQYKWEIYTQIWKGITPDTIDYVQIILEKQDWAKIVNEKDCIDIIN